MNGGGFSLVERDGLLVAICEPLVANGVFAHGFSTRRDARGGDFDLGSAGDRSSGTAARRRRFLAACGLDGAAPFVLEQVHGASVVIAGASDGAPPVADAVRWEPAVSPPAVPCVRSADCVPILLVDPERRAAAAVHAGWKGTAAGIVGGVLDGMVASGSLRGSIVAALGPAIGPCCYETGEEVAEAVAGSAAFADGIVRRPAAGGRPHVDLRAANRAQLLRGGVEAPSIHLAPWCTRCRNDLFFSYREEGAAAGRLMAAVGPAGRA